MQKEWQVKWSRWFHACAHLRGRWFPPEPLDGRRQARSWVRVSHDSSCRPHKTVARVRVFRVATVCTRKLAAVSTFIFKWIKLNFYLPIQVGVIEWIKFPEKVDECRVIWVNHKQKEKTDLNCLLPDSNASVAVPTSGLLRCLVSCVLLHWIMTSGHHHVPGDRHLINWIH